MQECELTPARKLQVLGKAARSDVLCGIFSFAQAGYDGQYLSAVQTTSLCRQGKATRDPKQVLPPRWLKPQSSKSYHLVLYKEEEIYLTRANLNKAIIYNYTSF